MFLLIYFAVIIILGLLFVISRNNKNDANGIPGLSLAQMIYLSVTSTSSSDFTQEIIKLHEKYGPIFKIHIKPFNPIIFTRNAEYIEKIFMSKDHLEKSFVYHIFEPFLGNGIASVRSMNEWKIDRKLVNCAMGQSFLTQLLSKTDSYINEFCDNVKNRHLHQPIDIQSHIHNVLLKVILETISNSSISLDWDMVSRYDEARARFYELSIERMLSIYLFPDTLHKFSNNYTDTQKVCKVLTAFANNLLRQHKLIQEPATNNHNLIQMLIDSGMSDDKIVSNINTIIEGGHDTSALTTTWMAYELSRNKVVQENILKEAIDVLGIDAQREITLKDVQEMKYIECFVSEVLRRYTILNILIRKVGKSVHINNNEVPEGSILVCIPHAIHTSREYYDDPTVFDPDRFLPENNVKLNPYAYIPFSVGPRNCIAKTFAIQQLKLIVAKLVLNFEIKPYEHKMDIVTQPVRKSKNGVFVILASRDIVNSKN